MWQGYQAQAGPERWFLNSGGGEFEMHIETIWLSRCSVKKAVRRLRCRPSENVSLAVRKKNGNSWLLHAKKRHLLRNALDKSAVRLYNNDTAGGEEPSMKDSGSSKENAWLTEIRDLVSNLEVTVACSGEPGAFNDILSVSDTSTFRCLRSSDGIERIKMRVALFDAMQRYISLSIPTPQFISEDIRSVGAACIERYMLAGRSLPRSNGSSGWPDGGRCTAAVVRRQNEKSQVRKSEPWKQQRG